MERFSLLDLCPDRGMSFNTMKAEGNHGALACGHWRTTLFTVSDGVAASKLSMWCGKVLEGSMWEPEAGRAEKRILLSPPPN
jgi:hypothetical protein